MKIVDFLCWLTGHICWRYMRTDYLGPVKPVTVVECWCGVCMSWGDNRLFYWRRRLGHEADRKVAMALMVAVILWAGWRLLCWT